MKVIVSPDETLEIRNAAGQKLCDVYYQLGEWYIEYKSQAYTISTKAITDKGEKNKWK